MVSIIIPFHNNIEMTKQCVNSVFKNTFDFEIILINNGSYEDFSDLRYTTISNDKNLGFPKAVNQGIKCAKGDFLCILNNDTIVTGYWLDNLLWHIEKGSLDMVGPLTNSISGPQQKILDVYFDEKELNKAAIKLYEENEHKHFNFYRLVGFCLLMRKEVVEKIGYFDEEFTPGLYEDDDFCLRAIDAGFKLGIAQDVFIHHFGSATFEANDIDQFMLMKKNKKYFDSKWPKDILKQLIERGTNG